MIVFHSRKMYKFIYKQKLGEPLSIFTKYKTTVTPKINILNLF